VNNYLDGSRKKKAKKKCINTSQPEAQDWYNKNKQSYTNYINTNDSSYKSSIVAEMGDRGHNRHGPKREVGAVVPLSRGELVPRLTQYGLGRGLLPHQMAPSSIQPFGHNRHGPKIGWGLYLFFLGGARSPSNTKSPGLGVLPYQVAS